MRAGRAAASGDQIVVRQHDAAVKRVRKLRSGLQHLFKDKSKHESLRRRTDIKIDSPCALFEVEAQKAFLKVTEGKEELKRAQMQMTMRQNQKAEALRDVDSAISASYKRRSRQMHPDKRRSTSAEDTLNFQKMKTAADVLKDPETRRLYLELLDHEKFIVTYAEQQELEAQREQKLKRRGRSKAKSGAGEGSSAPLSLGGGVPNRCTCPNLNISGSSLEEGFVMLEWRSHRAEDFAVSDYEVEAKLHSRVGGEKTKSFLFAETTTTLGPLEAGEWTFCVRARNSSGYGEFSMKTEVIAIGKEVIALTAEEKLAREEERQRKKVERQRAAQADARDDLARLTATGARRAHNLLGMIVHSVIRARNAGLPVDAQDGELLQKADTAIKELRMARDNAENIKKWRTELKTLSSSAATQGTSAMLELVQSIPAEEMAMAGVKDMLHQMVKRSATKVDTSRESAVKAVILLLRSAAEREDLWKEAKLRELNIIAGNLQREFEKATLKAKRTAERERERRRQEEVEEQARTAARREKERREAERRSEEERDSRLGQNPFEAMAAMPRGYGGGTNTVARRPQSGNGGGSSCGTSFGAGYGGASFAAGGGGGGGGGNEYDQEQSLLRAAADDSPPAGIGDRCRVASCGFFASVNGYCSVCAVSARIDGGEEEEASAPAPAPAPKQKQKQKQKPAPEQKQPAPQPQAHQLQPSAPQQRQKQKQKQKQRPPKQQQQSQQPHPPPPYQAPEEADFDEDELMAMLLPSYAPPSTSASAPAPAPAPAPQTPAFSMMPPSSVLSLERYNALVGTTADGVMDGSGRNRETSS